MTRMTRRNFLQTTGAFALAYAAAGGGARPSLAAREKELNIYCWEGYNSDDVLDPFRKEFDATVRAEGLTSDPDAINRLRAGGCPPALLTFPLLGVFFRVGPISIACRAARPDRTRTS